MPGQQCAAMPGGKLPGWTSRPSQSAGGTQNTRKSNSVYHCNTHAESSIPGSSLGMDARPK